MVVDARMANSFHLPPRHTALGSSAAYAQLDLSLDGVSDSGVGEIFEYRPSVNEADVQDCFWNFSCDELASYFGVDEPTSVAELTRLGFDVSSVYDERWRSGPWRRAASASSRP